MFDAMRLSRLAPLLLTVGAGRAGAAVPAPVTIVACAPGYPGTSAEAQPSMDAFAAAAAEAAGWPKGELAASYQESEQGGLARLQKPDAAVALVPLPFLARHGRSLGLEPRLQVEEKANGLTQVWSLVAKKGRVGAPAALGSFTVASIAGYAPGFVRAGLAGWGQLPESTRIVQSAQVLSSLRKAVAGEDVAVLLDASQAAALPSLPFAQDLEVVARTEPLPVAFVCTVGKRLPPARWKALAGGLEKLAGTPSGAAALEQIRMVRFVPADPAALATVSRLEGGAASGGGASARGRAGVEPPAKGRPAPAASTSADEKPRPRVSPAPPKGSR